MRVFGSMFGQTPISKAFTKSSPFSGYNTNLISEKQRLTTYQFIYSDFPVCSLWVKAYVGQNCAMVSTPLSLIFSCYRCVIIAKLECCISYGFPVKLKWRGCPQDQLLTISYLHVSNYIVWIQLNQAWESAVKLALKATRQGFWFLLFELVPNRLDLV